MNQYSFGSQNLQPTFLTFLVCSLLAHHIGLRLSCNISSIVRCTVGKGTSQCGGNSTGGRTISFQTNWVLTLINSLEMNQYEIS